MKLYFKAYYHGFFCVDLFLKALFGLQSPAAMVTVVGVLVEAPVMLSLVKFANRWKY